MNNRNDRAGVPSTGLRDHAPQFRASDPPEKVWSDDEDRNAGTKIATWFIGVAAVVVLGACFYAYVAML